MPLLRSIDPWGKACNESKNEWNLLRCYENCKKYLTKILGVSVSVILRKKRFRCLKENFGCLEKQQLCALTPNPELVGGLRSQLSVVFSQGHGCFWAHVLRGAERFASLFIFSIAMLSRMLQGDNEPSKIIYYGKILRAFLSCWFDMRWNFEEQPRISIFSAPEDEMQYK